jgi:hypothetical protein
MSTDNLQTYPIKWGWRLYALIFPLMGLALPGIMAWALLNANRPPDTATIVVVIIGGLILFALSLAIYFGMTRVCLTVSPQGIGYHSLGYQVVTTWDNIASIGDVRSGQYTYEGLVLREPRLEVSDWLRTGTAAYPFLALIGALSGRPLVPLPDMAVYGRGIPLGLFVTNWRQSPLGENIRRYAPHVFNPAAPGAV